MESKQDGSRKLQDRNEDHCRENRSTNSSMNRKNVNLTLEGRKLNQVEEFVYLGGKINENGSTVVLLR